MTVTMKNKAMLLSATAVMLLSPLCVAATAAEDAKTPQYQIKEDIAEDMSTTEKKIRLAAQIHQYRPVKNMIAQAAEQIALRYPEERRKSVTKAIIENIDYQKIREESIERMADVYTEAELNKMKEFYGSEEYQSISKKNDIYFQLVQPTVVKELDAVLINLRTGTSPQ